MRNVPVIILNADDSKTETGAAQFVGQALQGTFVPTCGDNSAGGTVKIQGSNDAPVGNPFAFVPTNWADIPSATSTIASGVGPAIAIQNLSYQYIRAVYTSGSGGTTTIIVSMSYLAV